MRDGDDVASRMGVKQAWHGAVDAGGDLVPALAAGGADVAGLIPEGTQMILIGDGIERLQFPCAEVNLAQVLIVGQSGAVGCDGIGRGAGADQVRRYHQRIFGQMRRQTADLRRIAEIGGNVRPPDHGAGMGRSMSDPEHAAHGKSPLSTCGSPAMTLTTNPALAASFWFSSPCA